MGLRFLTPFTGLMTKYVCGTVVQQTLQRCRFDIVFVCKGCNQLKNTWVGVLPIWELLIHIYIYIYSPRLRCRWKALVSHQKWGIQIQVISMTPPQWCFSLRSSTVWDGDVGHRAFSMSDWCEYNKQNGWSVEPAGFRHVCENIHLTHSPKLLDTTLRAKIPATKVSCPLNFRQTHMVSVPCYLKLTSILPVFVLPFHQQLSKVFTLESRCQHHLKPQKIHHESRNPGHLLQKPMDFP